MAYGHFKSACECFGEVEKCLNHTAGFKKLRRTHFQDYAMSMESKTKLVRVEFILKATHYDPITTPLTLDDCKVMLEELQLVYESIDDHARHLGFCYALQAKLMLKMGDHNVYDSQNLI